MHRLLASVFVLAIALPAAAQTYGGGGIIVHQAIIPWELEGAWGPNVVGCVGGIGYGVRNGKRAGGEGHFCDGPFSSMAHGGAHFGLQSKRAGLWATGYNTVGAGWLGVNAPDAGRADMFYVYTRPTAGLGVGIGHWAAIEGSVYAMLPLNVLGVVGPGVDSQLTFPHVGLQATLLFGDFSRRKRTKDVEDRPTPAPPPPPRQGYSAPPPPREGPPAAPPPQPQAPISPSDLPRVGDPQEPPPPPPPQDDRPLAIPG